MSKIKQLSQALANQIAAGEVVERPASVVKELVENSIDAGSTQITVEVIESGVQQIKVIDNGEGMTPDDLEMAFKPHATSKIFKIQDLFEIRSLGFRGEALASIGSVAKVRAESTPKNYEQGYFVEIEDSIIKNQGPTNARLGTTMTVDSLFYNTPARLKHLKTLQTELRHIVTFIQNIALSYPTIRFNLYNDNKLIISSVGNGDLRQTIANVYQPAVARQLIEINAKNEDFNIHGFISPPQLTRTNRNYIHWILNGRVVKNYAMSEVLIKAYKRQIMIGRYPIAIIAIDLDPRLVDVNVHPTKDTVRLSKEDDLAELIEQAVSEKLELINPIPYAMPDEKGNKVVEPNIETTPLEFIYEPPKDEDKSISRQQRTEKNFSESMPVTQETDSGIIESEHMIPSQDIDLKNDRTLELEEEVNDSLETFSNPVKKLNRQFLKDANRKRPDFRSLRYLGQIHGTYLACEGENGFYLIDQHAAHERIRYEKFMEFDPDVSLQQMLLIPLMFNFTTAEKVIIDQMQEKLELLGIHLESFGPTSYQLHEYPNWIQSELVESTIRDLIERLIDHPQLSIAELQENSIAMFSCRGAIKANERLTKEQAEAIIHDLEGLDDPFHCIHGRPVFVEFTSKDLEKMFKRIQDSHEGRQYR